MMGGNSGSSSLRSPEALRASAHSGDDPGRIFDVIDDLESFGVWIPNMPMSLRRVVAENLRKHFQGANQ